MKNLTYSAAIANGDPIDADPLNDILSDIQDLINTTKLDIDNLNGGSPGKVALSNGSGVPAWTTVSGDATISSAGVVTLAAEQHYGLLGGDVTITPNAGYQNLIQATMTTGGIVQVIGSIDFEYAGSGSSTGGVTGNGRLVRGITPQSGGPTFTYYMTTATTAEVARSTCAFVWHLSVNAGDVLTLQAQTLVTLSVSSYKAKVDGTSLSVVRIA